ncbi:MAG TPA: hypothetical protein VGF94_01905 [Kofleriaceae bacterium]
MRGPLRCVKCGHTKAAGEVARVLRPGGVFVHHGPLVYHFGADAALRGAGVRVAATPKLAS